MPFKGPGDYRDHSFDLSSVIKSGMYLGKYCYWKLFCIENIMRVVINSILQIQLGPDWWDVVLDSLIEEHISRVRDRQLRFPNNNSPGEHDIYCIYLTDITKILRTNSHLFMPVIPDVDDWIVRLEEIQGPRNLIGHMNWINEYDFEIVHQTYFESKSLLRNLESRGIAIEIPE